MFYHNTTCFCSFPQQLTLHICDKKIIRIRDGPFDIRGGGGFRKIVCFLIGGKK